MVELAMGSHEGLRYAARQPILNHNEKVCGYELLFRDGPEAYFSICDSDAATKSIFDTATLLGLDVLCGGQCAFINCTREILLKDYVTLLPPEKVVVEILGTVPPDEQVRAACGRLKRSGYRIALDTFATSDARESLTDFADMIKVDWTSTSFDEGVCMVKRYKNQRRSMIATKVETREEFAAATKAGFSHFQGYFFRKPETMQARELPADKVIYLQLLKAVSQPEADLQEVEKILKQEVSLCYRLLRYLNSAAFGLQNELSSVRQAIAILGEREVRRWVRLIGVLCAGQNKPSELVVSALIRARFGELLGAEVKHGGSELFLVGLLSLMDVILDVPMYVVVEGIPLQQDIRSVLLGQASSLTPVHQLVLAQENGEWQTVARLSAQLCLSDDFVTQSYWDSLRWVRQLPGQLKE
jgi:EAL and modified HD-GYP domain-containing signal transduction protein